MDSLWPIKRFCRWVYELDDDEEPKVSQTNSVAKQCRDGTLPAVKVCNRWFIDTAQILEGVRNG